MLKSKKNQESLKKEEVLQAVLLADDFHDVFGSFVAEKASVLLPVVNCPVLDYALECLGRSGIQETILFCSTNADVIKAHVKKSKWSQPYSTMIVNVVVSERCQSLGDAMRDLDNKAIIKGDFVLMSAFTVSNLNLLSILEHHRGICKVDRGAAMTLVLQDVGASNPRSAESVIAINSVNDRLLFHSKPGNDKKIQFPLEYLLEFPQVEILNHMVDSGIAICSPSVPLLFSDNFDFQTKDDFIRGLLLNEEILASRIYCWQGGGGYGQTVRDWPSYQRVSRDVTHRYTFPLVPDQPLSFSEEPFAHYRNGVYKQPGVKLGMSCDPMTDVVIGKNSSFGDQVTLHRSVIGRNCRIGHGVHIQDSFVLDNAVIGDACRVELSVLGEGAELKKNCHVRKCVVKQAVVLEGKQDLQDCLLARTGGAGGWEKLSAHAWALRGSGPPGDGATDGEDEEDGPEAAKASWLVDPDAVCTDGEPDEEESDSEEEEGGNASPELDDTNVFYCEVIDSLQRGFEEKLSCDNLILEINSSRYAYNVTLSDVTTLTVKAILMLKTRLLPPGGQAVKPLLTYFLPLLKNYIKNAQAQNECLAAIEEAEDVIGQETTKCLYFLYQSDVLSEEVILPWFEQLESDSTLRPKVAPLVKWLQDADEESSSGESE